MLGARLAAAMMLAVPASTAALFHRSSPQDSAERASAITLRKRLHVNTLITLPATMEIEWGGSFSWDGSYTLKAWSIRSPATRPTRRCAAG